MPFLSRFRARKHTFSSPLAPDERFSAIGDIHGRDDLFCQLLDKMAETEAVNERVVTVGDYIDRGEESAQVLRRLRDYHATAEGQLICLKGNHEDMLLKFLDDPTERGPRWLRYGGLQTFASFQLAPPSETAPAMEWVSARDRLRETMGPELEAWLRSLPSSWQSGNVTVVHAGADPAQPISAQPERTLLWGHPEFEATPRRDGQWVVHGHTIVDQPQVIEGRIAIDTGAYATGRLTAARITPGNVDILST